MGTDVILSKEPNLLETYRSISNSSDSFPASLAAAASQAAAAAVHFSSKGRAGMVPWASEISLQNKTQPLLTG